MARATASQDKRPGVAGREVVAVINPYPRIALYLGTYYNEIGQSTDALRVLEAGLALPTVADQGMGEFRPHLISERGAALTALKRWPEALAAYDMGAEMTGLEGRLRGRMLRGRGFALTEMGRLDEAEKSYRDSLAVDPNNATATAELKYIAKLRAGGPTQQPGIIRPGAQK
jgi:tetratricopeptide (TPR) repeat protein